MERTQPAAPQPLGGAGAEIKEVIRHLRRGHPAKETGLPPPPWGHSR